MELGSGSVSGAISRRLDGRWLITTAALAGVCLFVVAGSAQLGRHPSATGVQLYSTVVSHVLGRRGGGSGICVAAVSVPKARIVAEDSWCNCPFILQPISRLPSGI